MNPVRKLLFFTIFCTVVSSAFSVICYKCLYDESYPDLQGTTDDCIDKPSKVSHEGGFKQCYKAIVMSKEGKIVSAHRGGGKADLYEYAEKVSRDEASFDVSYCNEDYCNGAPSVAMSLGLFTLNLALLRSFTTQFLL